MFSAHQISVSPCLHGSPAPAAAHRSADAEEEEEE